MSESEEEVTVDAAGVTVRKSLNDHQFETLAVVFDVRAGREEAANVTLIDEVPEDVPIDDIGFHPEYGSEHWHAGESQVVFSRTFEPGEQYTTVYGVRAFDGDQADLLAEPAVEVGPPGEESEAVADIDDLVSEEDSEMVREVISGERDTLPGLGDDAAASAEPPDEAVAGDAEAGDEEPPEEAVADADVDPEIAALGSDEPPSEEAAEADSAAAGDVDEGAVGASDDGAEAIAEDGVEADEEVDVGPQDGVPDDEEVEAPAVGDGPPEEAAEADAGAEADEAAEASAEDTVEAEDGPEDVVEAEEGVEPTPVDEPLADEPEAGVGSGPADVGGAPGDDDEVEEPPEGEAADAGAVAGPADADAEPAEGADDVGEAEAAAATETGEDGAVETAEAAGAGDGDEEIADEEITVPVTGGIARVLAKELRAGNVSHEDRRLLREELLPDDGSTDARIRRLQNQVADLAAYADALEQFLDEEGGAEAVLDRVEERVESLAADVEAVEESVEEVGDDLESVAEDVEDVEDDVEAVETDVESVEGDVERVDDAVDRLEGDVDAVRDDVARLDEVDRRVGQVEEDVSAIHDELEDLAAFRERLTSVFGAGGGMEGQDDAEE